MKRLLVLGGTSSSYDIVKEAKKCGVHVTVVDKEPVDVGVSKKIADESYVVDTTDVPGLVKLIVDKNIDGVFCGPSEFNLVNVRRVCEAAHLPFYCTKEQWDICSNKVLFKQLCRRFGVPCVPEYYVTAELKEQDLKKVHYPVIVKPVDGCSSIGLSFCFSEEELKKAVPAAMKVSKSGRIIVEKCITSDYGFGCRYIANNGEIYLSAVCDRYTVDESGGKALISSGAIFPSKKIDTYIHEINPKVIQMFQSIGIQNGTFFMQALVDQDDDKIYFHEMGLRLSGGLIYSMLEASCGYNDVQMMIRYALGGPMVTDDELKKIDPYMHGHYIGSLTIPLKAGAIGYIEGVEQIRENPQVTDFVQYYREGDCIEPQYVGTLLQHFCRVKMMTDSIVAYRDMVDWVQRTIKIKDKDGNNMIYRLFDTNRMK